MRVPLSGRANGRQPLFNYYNGIYVEREAVMAKKKTYAQLAEEAKAEGKAKQVSYKVHDKFTEGESIVGKVEDAALVNFDEQADPVIQYVLDTDEGRQSCLFGRGTDKQISGMVRLGDVIEATYKGQKEIKGGHKVNVFEVFILSGGDGVSVFDHIKNEGGEIKTLERDLSDNGTPDNSEADTE